MASDRDAPLRLGLTDIFPPFMRNITIYLDDHLAGSVGALELLDHLIETSKNQSIITTLKTLREDIHQDQVVLHEIVRQLGGKESVTRKVGAWAAEKLSRAKLDAEDDQLGLLQALEGLGLGIIGKRGLWRTLSTVSATITALQGLDCIGLENRAEDQFARVEAACLALAPSALSLT